MGVTLTQEMINGAKKTEKEYGVPASVTLGQIMLESGGSYSGGLSGLAYNYNNLFGVTAGSSWTGKTIYMTNKNGSDGHNYRVYNSVADSITDHAKVLQADRYTQYISKATTVSEYVDGIAKGGYAEDKNYATKLKNIIKDNNLTQYDSGNIGAGTLTGSGSGSSSGSTDNKNDDINMFGNIVVVVIAVLCIGLAVYCFCKSIGLNLSGGVTSLATGGLL